MLRLAFFLLLIYIKAPLPLFIIAIIINIFPEFYLILHLSKKFVKPKIEFDAEIWKYLLKEAWPIAITALFVLTYHRMDQLMLFQMRGDEAVGYYSAAVGLSEAFIIFPSAFMTSVFPLMSKYFNTSEQSLVETYTLSFKYLMMLIIPVAMGTTILSESIISFFYGEKFVKSSPALAILIWSQIFAFYGFIHYQILISTNRQKIYLLFCSIGAISNIVLNYLLIPKYGIIGASIATLVSYILSAGTIIGYLVPATRIYNVVGCKALINPAVASAIMGIFVYYTKSHVIMAVTGGIAIFAVTMITLRGIDGRDIELARTIYRGVINQEH
jgi:O-antigen/teichoic acid export membrane protein